MRNFDSVDLKEIQNIEAEPWMLGLLEMNPDYTSWSNYEDYMGGGRDGAWDSPFEINSANELFGLDDLNELVNFYFEIIRPSETCSHCEGKGYNQETQKLRDSWFAFDDPDYIWISDKQRYNNNAWQYHLTKHEVDALWDENRLRDFKYKPTPEEVNDWAIHNMGHDAINQSICVKARAEKLGVFGYCEKCKGNEEIFDPAIKAHVELQMWMLHPRKGCSRGVRLMKVEKEDLPVVFDYLKEAKKRFNEKFSKIPDNLKIIE